jgi:hypothetical protein
MYDKTTTRLWCTLNRPKGQRNVYGFGSVMKAAEPNACAIAVEPNVHFAAAVGLPDPTRTTVEFERFPVSWVSD